MVSAAVEGEAGALVIISTGLAALSQGYVVQVPVRIRSARSVLVDVERAGRAGEAVGIGLAGCAQFAGSAE